MAGGGGAPAIPPATAAAAAVARGGRLQRGQSSGSKTGSGTTTHQRNRLTITPGNGGQTVTDARTGRTIFIGRRKGFIDDSEIPDNETAVEKKRRLNRNNERRKRARRVFKIDYLTQEQKTLTESNTQSRQDNQAIRDQIAALQQHLSQSQQGQGQAGTPLVLPPSLAGLPQAGATATTNPGTSDPKASKKSAGAATVVSLAVGGINRGVASTHVSTAPNGGDLRYGHGKSTTITPLPPSASSTSSKNSKKKRSTLSSLQHLVTYKKGGFKPRVRNRSPSSEPRKRRRRRRDSNEDDPLPNNDIDVVVDIHNVEPSENRDTDILVDLGDDVDEASKCNNEAAVVAFTRPGTAAEEFATVNANQEEATLEDMEPLTSTENEDDDVLCLPATKRDDCSTCSFPKHSIGGVTEHSIGEDAEPSIGGDVGTGAAPATFGFTFGTESANFDESSNAAYFYSGELPSSQDLREVLELLGEVEEDDSIVAQELTSIDNRKGFSVDCLVDNAEESRFSYESELPSGGKWDSADDFFDTISPEWSVLGSDISPSLHSTVEEEGIVVDDMMLDEFPLAAQNDNAVIIIPENEANGRDMVPRINSSSGNTSLEETQQQQTLTTQNSQEVEEDDAGKAQTLAPCSVRGAMVLELDEIIGLPPPTTNLRGSKALEMDQLLRLPSPIASTETTDPPPPTTNSKGSKVLEIDQFVRLPPPTMPSDRADVVYPPLTPYSMPQQNLSPEGTNYTLLIISARQGSRTELLTKVDVRRPLNCSFAELAENLGNMKGYMWERFLLPCDLRKVLVDGKSCMPHHNFETVVGSSPSPTIEIVYRFNRRLFVNSRLREDREYKYSEILGKQEASAIKLTGDQVKDNIGSTGDLLLPGYLPFSNPDWRRSISPGWSSRDRELQLGAPLNDNNNNQEDRSVLKNLSFEELLQRPSLGDDGCLDKELLQLWGDNLFFLQEGRSCPYPKLHKESDPPPDYDRSDLDQDACPPSPPIPDLERSSECKKQATSVSVLEKMSVVNAVDEGSSPAEDAVVVHESSSPIGREVPTRTEAFTSSTSVSSLPTSNLTTRKKTVERDGSSKKVLLPGSTLSNLQHLVSCKKPVFKPRVRNRAPAVQPCLTATATTTTTENEAVGPNMVPLSSSRSGNDSSLPSNKQQFLPHSTLSSLHSLMSKKRRGFRPRGSKKLDKKSKEGAIPDYQHQVEQQQQQQQQNSAANQTFQFGGTLAVPGFNFNAGSTPATAPPASTTNNATAAAVAPAGGFTFGNNNNNAPTPAPSTGTTPSGGFSFGNNNAPTTAASMPAPASTTAGDDAVLMDKDSSPVEDSMVVDDGSFHVVDDDKVVHENPLVEIVPAETDPLLSTNCSLGKRKQRTPDEIVSKWLKPKPKHVISTQKASSAMTSTPVDKGGDSAEAGAPMNPDRETDRPTKTRRVERLTRTPREENGTLDVTGYDIIPISSKGRYSVPIGDIGFKLDDRVPPQDLMKKASRKCCMVIDVTEDGYGHIIGLKKNDWLLYGSKDWPQLTNTESFLQFLSREKTIEMFVLRRKNPTDLSQASSESRLEPENVDAFDEEVAPAPENVDAFAGLSSEEEDEEAAPAVHVPASVAQTMSLQTNHLKAHGLKLNLCGFPIQLPQACQQHNRRVRFNRRVVIDGRSYCKTETVVGKIARARRIVALQEEQTAIQQLRPGIHLANCRALCKACENFSESIVNGTSGLELTPEESACAALRKDLHDRIAPVLWKILNGEETDRYQADAELRKKRNQQQSKSKRKIRKGGNQRRMDLYKITDFAEFDRRLQELLNDPNENSIVHLLKAEGSLWGDPNNRFAAFPELLGFLSGDAHCQYGGRFVKVGTTLCQIHMCSAMLKSVHEANEPYQQGNNQMHRERPNYTAILQATADWNSAPTTNAATSTPKSASITFFHVFNKKPIDDQEALDYGYRAGKFIDTFRKKLRKWYKKDENGGHLTKELKALRSRNKEEYDSLLVSVPDCQRMLDESFVESGLDNNLESSPLAREMKQKLSDILAGNWGSDTDNNRIRECLLRGLVYASVVGQSSLHILDYYIKFCLPSSHRGCIKFRPDVIRELVFNRCEKLPRPFNTNPLVSKFRALAAMVSNEGGGTKARLNVSVDDHFRHLEFWRQLSLDCLGIYPYAYPDAGTGPNGTTLANIVWDKIGRRRFSRAVMTIPGVLDYFCIDKRQLIRKHSRAFQEEPNVIPCLQNLPPPPQHETDDDEEDFDDEEESDDEDDGDDLQPEHDTDDDEEDSDEEED